MTGKMNVLCAARDYRMMDMLRRALDDAQHCCVQIVSTGPAAIEYALCMPPDILVIDAVLPGMDGLGVIDCLRVQLAERAPHIIACVPEGMQIGFQRRDVERILSAPWRLEALEDAVRRMIEEIGSGIDWNRARHAHLQACVLLEQMGVNGTLKGFEYLAWAAALAVQAGERRCAVGRELYKPIAERMHTSPQSVERLIRHAIESAMNDGHAASVYGFFGNTIDPTRGKPTNAQVIGALRERLRTQA